MGEGVVKKSEKNADVFYGWSLSWLGLVAGNFLLNLQVL